jgi:hypothetical protein
MLKNIILTSLVILLLATATFVAAKAKNGNSGSKSSGSSVSSMTQAQKDTLLFIYQEEKVARDVYTTLGNYYQDQKVFANIQLSEQEHMDSVQKLCEKYGVDISGVDETLAGSFVLPVFQELYDTLVIQGYQSELSALMVGEYIEMRDIDDIQDAQEGMPADVVKVFEHLKEGSYNHLEAFRSAIDVYKR